MQMLMSLGKLSVRIIEAMCQRSIVIIFRTTNYQVGNNTSGDNDIQSSFGNCVGFSVITAIFQSLLAILEQRISTSTSYSLTKQGSVEQVYTTSCQLNFKFFRHSVTNACPEKFNGRFCDNLGVNEDMVAATFTVVVTCHTSVRFIHYAQRSRRSAVGSQSREVEQGLTQFICQNFAAVSSTTTTNTENHISFLYAFFCHQHINIFVGCVAAKPFATNNFQITASDTFFNRFSCHGKSSLTAN